MTKVKNERRRYQRVEANIKVSFQPKGQQKIYPSLIINMSQGGMLLKSSSVFPLDLILMIKIDKGTFSKKDITIPASISRCDTIYEKELYHLAVAIDRSTKETSKAIDDFYTGILEFKKKDSEQRLKN